MIAEIQSTRAKGVPGTRGTIDVAAMSEDTASPLEVRIAYIGGGSREWAIKLMGDLALTERLTGSLALYDIDAAAALHNEKISQEIFHHGNARTSFKVKAEVRLEEALRGADFVVISIEPGPTALRYADIEIPAKYGVLQTVGDTTGPGGIVRGLRCVPLFQEFARAIMTHCPRAWVINYTNPMALCTATLFAEAPSIKAFGCCHEVFGIQKTLASLVADWFRVPTPAREEIKLDLAGVNHFTWATRASWQGQDLMPRLLEQAGDEAQFQAGSAHAKQALQKSEWFNNLGLVSYDLLRRFGALGAAGDRHLVEFVPWYLSSEEELHRWGVIRTPFHWRLERSKKPAAGLGSYMQKELRPSGEEGVDLIEALAGLRTLVTNVNLPNAGQLAGFPHGAVVETYACVSQDRIQPVVAGPLPMSVASMVRRTMDEQTLVLEAGLQRNRQLALQAMMNHPLVHLPVTGIEAMLDEMLAATREMLPGW